MQSDPDYKQEQSLYDPRPQWLKELTDRALNAPHSAGSQPTLFDCAKCDSKDFQDTASPMVLFQLKDKIIDFKSGIFVYAIACRKCGFMELRSLTAMGIDPTK